MIAPGRKREIADEFLKRLSENETIEQACEALGRKYSLTHGQVKAIVDEVDDDGDGDPDGRQVA